MSDPQCPNCGYTAKDAEIQGDHHLCDGKIPEGDDEDAPNPESPKDPTFEVWTTDEGQGKCAHIETNGSKITIPLGMSAFGAEQSQAIALMIRVIRAEARRQEARKWAVWKDGIQRVGMGLCTLESAFENIDEEEAETL